MDTKSLSIDKKEEKYNAPPASEMTGQERRLKELHDNRFEKKGARRAFHAVNFLGLHQIFNNVASVIITYTMATSGLADKMKNGMSHGPIGKGLSAILSLPGKAVNGAFRLCGVDLLKGIPEAEKAAELAARAHKSQRNAIETAFMCVAGFITLLPVYLLEKHRAGFLNTADNWLHPGRSKEEKKAAALTKEDEPKETLWNLFRARMIALGVVFGIDQLRDNIDSHLKFKHHGKPGMYKNIDSVAGWGLGNWIYDRLPERTRNWLARFFSGSLKGDNVRPGSIQDEVLEDVWKAVGNPDTDGTIKKIAEEGRRKRLNFDKPNIVKEAQNTIKTLEEKVVKQSGLNAVERAVFAEQSRLFITKEVFLTTILSAVIYTCAKAGFMSRFFEKIGLQKKGTYEKEKAEREARRNGKVLSANPVEALEQALKTDMGLDGEDTQPSKQMPGVKAEASKSSGKKATESVISEATQEKKYADTIKSPAVMTSSKEPLGQFAAKQAVRPAENWQAGVSKSEADAPNLTQVI